MFKYKMGIQKNRKFGDDKAIIKELEFQLEFGLRSVYTERKMHEHYKCQSIN